MRRKDIEGLLPVLESEDAFSRLVAEQELRNLALRDFGFRWDADETHRAAALLRVRRWIEEAARREKVRATALSGLAAAGLTSLQGLAPEDVEKHLVEFLSHVQSSGAVAKGPPPCDSCGKRPATVDVVEVRDLAALGHVRTCETCAGERGLFRA